MFKTCDETRRNSSGNKGKTIVVIYVIAVRLQRRQFTGLPTFGKSLEWDIARERSDQARGREAPEGGMVWKGGVPPSTVGSFYNFAIEMVQSGAYFNPDSTNT